MFRKPADECFAGMERVTPKQRGDPFIGLVIPSMYSKSLLLIVFRQVVSELTVRANIWAYPRLPANTVLYYTLLPTPYPLLALVGLGIYEIFCFAGTENLRLLLNWSMSEHSLGTRYPREQA